MSIMTTKKGFRGETLSIFQIIQTRKRTKTLRKTVKLGHRVECQVLSHREETTFSNLLDVIIHHSMCLAFIVQKLMHKDMANVLE